MHQRLQERDRAEALAGQPRSPRTTPRGGREMTVRRLWRNVVANCAHIVSSHAGASASITVPDVAMRARRDLCHLDDSSNGGGQGDQADFDGALERSRHVHADKGQRNQTSCPRTMPGPAQHAGEPSDW